jgi:parallel beta-helix repeat protein
LIENNIIDGNLQCGIGFFGGSNNTVINNIITNEPLAKLFFVGVKHV